MNKQQKILFFALGVIVGLMMVANLFKTRAEKKREVEAAADRRILPGMLVEWAREGRAVYDESGKGVLESRLGPGAEGFGRTRRVLVGGRRRTAPTGREAPPEFLCVTEFYAEAGEPTPKTPVKRMDFAFADRIRVVVREPAHGAVVYRRLRDLGAHLSPDPDSRTALTVRFERPTLDTVPSALAAVAGMPELVSAEAVRIDWARETAP